VGEPGYASEVLMNGEDEGLGNPYGSGPGL
jgi:hypothetical protein